MSKKIKNNIIKFLLIIVIAISTYIYETYFEETSTAPVIEYRQEETIKIDQNNLVIHYIDVGQGDCILISKNNEHVLIDAGNNEDGPLLVEYFKELGIKKFNYVIGTHAHEDHIGGIDNIINNFDLGHYYMPDVITTTKTFEDVLDALLNKNKAFETPKIGDKFKIKDAEFEVLYLGKDKSDLNNTSIVLKLTYQNTVYLFMGDATDKVEKILIDEGKELASDVLKVGHHGSQYSSTAAFLKEVNPSYAVIQVGENNDYDHPKQITLDKLDKLKTLTYRTDKHGTIVLTSDGENISFETIKTNTNGEV